MNVKKIICLPLALLFFLISAPARAFAETRNIYIGDIITLQLESQKFSAEEIREKFKDFEIIEIREENGGCLVSARTFQIGEHRIVLGGREIVINVSSTLEDINRDDIFEAEKEAEPPGFLFWHMLFYIFSAIFILSGGFVVYKKLAGKKSETQSPLESFMDRCSSLSDEDENYLVDLTRHFKEYIEALHKLRIIGKTSAEIAIELQKIDAIDMPPILEWLVDCDRLKFAGTRATSEEKKARHTKLLYLVKEIDLRKEEKHK